MVGGCKNEMRRDRLRTRGLIAAWGAVVTLAAGLIAGCGGGSNTSILPFAGVWVANSATPNLTHYAGSELNLTGVSNLAPATMLSSSSFFFSPQDVTFDASGNIWVVDGGVDNGTGFRAAVYEFVLSQLKNLNSNSSPSPAFIITSPLPAPIFNFPQFGVFGGGHILWVSDSANNVILKFSAAQLASPTRTALTAAAMLQGALPGTFFGPLGMAFDSGGNLWVANNTGNTIVEISSVQLAAASGPVNPITPVVTLTSTTAPSGLPSINKPWGLLLDSNNNLWFTNEQSGPCSGTVVEISATNAAAGISTPTVELTQTAINGTESLCDPNGISMSAAIAPASVGNISVANAQNSTVAEYTASQITSSGAPTPSFFIDGPATKLNIPTGLSYGPLSLQ
jgi:hypothetical protein